MVHTPFKLRALLALLTLAILAMPVSGVHLHLCFDGNEAPTTVHAAEDGGHHSGLGMHLVHHDVDVSLESSAHAKKYDGPLLLLGIVAAFLQLTRSSADFRAPPLERSVFLLPASVFRILPPLRAPPR